MVIMISESLVTSNFLIMAAIHYLEQCMHMINIHDLKMVIPFSLFSIFFLKTVVFSEI